MDPQIGIKSVEDWDGVSLIFSLLFCMCVSTIEETLHTDMIDSYFSLEESV